MIEGAGKTNVRGESGYQRLAAGTKKRDGCRGNDYGGG